MSVDPLEQRAAAEAALERDPARQAEIARLAAHVRGRRAKWAHRSPALTRRDQDTDFEAAEARIEKERDTRS